MWPGQQNLSAAWTLDDPGSGTEIAQDLVSRKTLPTHVSSCCGYKDILIYYSSHTRVHY